MKEKSMDRLLCVGKFNQTILAIINRQCENTVIIDPFEAIEYFGSERSSIRAVLMSLRMKEMGGIDAMEQIHRIDPDLPVIISTHDTTVARIVDAMQRGAFNYLYEPRLGEELPYVLTRAFSYMNAILENRRLQKEAEKEAQINRLIGISPAMTQVKETIEKTADSSLPVLFTGESGTGKEMAARTLHDIGPRSKKQFIAVNCGAFPSTLLEAELFGYEKGAFTGADHAHSGLFEQAHNGTLFLDEIGLTETEFQVKLLRVLEHGELRRIGDEKTRRFNVRIITATNENLEKGVKQGTFRQDLLYRLNVITIDIPPLRERREDISVLAKYFLDRIQAGNTDAPEHISASALETLERYDWPGNGRELRNTIERAALLGKKDRIRVHDLPEHITAHAKKTEPYAPKGLTVAMAELEVRLIRNALSETGGNRSKAAEKLKINRTTLIEKMKRMGIK